MKINKSRFKKFNNNFDRILIPITNRRLKMKISNLKFLNISLFYIGKTLIVVAFSFIYGSVSFAESRKVPLKSEGGSDSFSLPPVEKVLLSGAILYLEKVQFSGHTVFNEMELQAIATPFISKNINYNDLENLRFLVSQYYSKHGYVNSGAILPDQNLHDGVLEIKIIEGKLTKINVNGEGWLHPDYIRGRLLDQRVLNVNDLQESYLMLINNPLIDKLNGNLKPTNILGESQLDLDVSLATPYGLSIHGNNYRAPSIGAEHFLVNGWVRNLTRWGDLINFDFGLSEGSTIYAGGIVLPLNSRGTLVDFHFDLSNASVIEEPLNGVDIGSEVENFSWSLSHPFYKSLDHTVILGVSFATKFNKTTLLGKDFSFVEGLDGGSSRISVVRVLQEYLGHFNNHILVFRSIFNIGIDAFNSTIQTNNTLPDSEYFSWLGQFQYAFKVLNNGAQIKVRGALQVSNQTLLSQERISIGGVSSVRGYRENELVRDEGYNGSIEFHYPVIGELGRAGHKLILIPFMDYGKAWNKGETSDYLHSVGIGFNWQPIRYISADFYYGYDIKRAREKSEYNLQDDGIHFNFTLTSY